MLISCNNNYIEDYEKYLNLDFPNDIEMIENIQKSNFQDYSNLAIYNLTVLQRDNILRQIEDRYCNNSNSNNYGCWYKADNFYSLKVSDSTIMSGYYLDAILIATDNINTLTIKEVKWK